MFIFKCNVIAALALAFAIGCVRTESVEVQGPNGSEYVKTTDSLIASKRQITIVNDKAYSDCMSTVSPTEGSARADAYCRFVTTSGSSLYRPAGPYMMPGMQLGPIWYPPPAPLGPHMNRGSIADPDVANYIVANARADSATYPEAAKNPQEFVRRNEIRGLYKQTRVNDAHINAVDTDLRDHVDAHSAPGKGASK